MRGQWTAVFQLCLVLAKASNSVFGCFQRAVVSYDVCVQAAPARIAIYGSCAARADVDTDTGRRWLRRDEFVSFWELGKMALTLMGPLDPRSTTSREKLRVGPPCTKPPQAISISTLTPAAMVELQTPGSLGFRS